MNSRYIIAWAAIVAFCFGVAVLLSGCEAMQPRLHADSTGYEAGVSGTWDGVAKSVQSLFSKTGDEPVFGGK